jgi:hypothetical protein
MAAQGEALNKEFARFGGDRGHARGFTLQVFEEEQVSRTSWILTNETQIELTTQPTKK